MSVFYNRDQELRSLERLWEATGGQLVLVWGRRRTGKSFLLTQFGKGKRAIFYTATERAPEVELADFSDQVRKVLQPGPRDLLASGPFRSWDEALGYLASAASRQRLLVVLDEFSYLTANDPSLASVIQRFWDHQGSSSKLRLVLCGSATGVLGNLGAERAPLFGRFTGRLQVHPFSYLEAAAFHPKVPAEQRAIIHGITGGMPLYLKMWKSQESVQENLVRLFADPASPLVNEGELLLRTELPDAAGYFRLMAAVASGRTKFSELRDVARIDPTRGLERLVAVRLLERRTPVTEDADRTRLKIYRVADNFLSFWFRFIYPNRGQIERGLGPEVVRGSVLPFLDDHMGLVFEEMCREYIRRKAAAGDLQGVTRVGAWWSADSAIEIDVVALARRRAVLAGEAKWARTADARTLRELRGKAQRIPNAADDLALALFARQGFREVTPEDALLVTASGLYK